MISDSSHLTFTSNIYISFNVSGVYKINYEDGYRGPANTIFMNPGSINPNIDIVIIENKTVNGLILIFSSH